MKVYLERGHSMDASLRIDPYKIQYGTVGDYQGVPPEIKTHALVIVGYADETVTIQGNFAELKELVKLMVEALKGAKE